MYMYVCMYVTTATCSSFRQENIYPCVYDFPLLTSKLSHWRQSSENDLSLVGLLSNMKSTEMQSRRWPLRASKLPGEASETQPWRCVERRRGGGVWRGGGVCAWRRRRRGEVCGEEEGDVRGGGGGGGRCVERRRGDVCGGGGELLRSGEDRVKARGNTKHW